LAAVVIAEPARPAKAPNLLGDGTPFFGLPLLVA
jgi:hypothetical protein